MDERVQTQRSQNAASFARGVHHLALCTDDIKKTTEFYTRVLGMPLIHCLKVPPGLELLPLKDAQHSRMARQACVIRKRLIMSGKPAYFRSIANPNA